MSENTNKLKVGVIGLGKMGVMHACLLNILPNVKVSALCDKSRLMTTIAKRVFHDVLVTDKIEKFDDLNLDAIYVLTPIPSHYPLIKEIYAQDFTKNIFVEKTLTTSYAQSKELCTISKKHHGITMVGYMKRFGVTFKHAKTLLDTQVLGSLISFDAYAFSSDFANIPQGSTISKARGGVLEDLGSHVIDLSVWYFKELTVNSAKVKYRISPTSEDAVSFNITGSNNLQGKFDVSWCKNGYRMPEFGLSILGTNGTLTVNDDEVRLELNKTQPKKWYRQDLGDNVGFLLGGPEYYREDKHFIDSITQDQNTESDFESALNVDLIIEQVRRKITNE